MNIQTGIFWLVLTVFLEARNQPIAGQKNVAKIILNRGRKKNKEIFDIVLAPEQFSCYNNGLLSALKAVALERQHIATVTANVNRAILEWEAGNDLQGATLYFNPKEVPGGWPESWKKKRTKFVVQEADHIFLKEV